MYVQFGLTSFCHWKNAKLWTYFFSKFKYQRKYRRYEYAVLQGDNPSNEDYKGANKYFRKFGLTAFCHWTAVYNHVNRHALHFVET